MTKGEQMASMEQRVRAVLREAYHHGVARIRHWELTTALGRERATKGFHSDIKGLWENEMELLDYEENEMPGLRYCWIPGVHEWAFVYEGKSDDQRLEWTII
jgi:hypothetical protein